MHNDSHWQSLFSLKGETVLITGAGGQLGSTLVLPLVQFGARVVATDISQKGLEARADELGWNERDVTLIAMDVRKKDEVGSGFEQAVRAVGVINHLINNAGVSVFEPFMDRNEESLDWVINVNLKGTFWCTQEYLRRKESNIRARGSIVNVASHYGVISPDPRIYTDCKRRNSEIYGATKAGIIQMTKYFAVHGVEFGIRVNAISPGGIRNPVDEQGNDFQRNYGFRCPLGRLGETSEVIGPVLFLLSRAAGYITGQNIIVDGGMTSW